MALITQMVDVPLTAGVDSKTTDFTSSPPGTAQFSNISNMRSDYRAGFIPRGGFTQTMSVTLPSIGWIVASPTAQYFDVGNGGGLFAGGVQGSAIPASGKMVRRSFGSQLGTDPNWIACEAHGSSIVMAWAYTNATAGPPVAIQIYNPATDTSTYSGSISTVLTSLQVTSGNGTAVLWGLTASGSLNVYTTPDASQPSLIGVGATHTNITAFDVVYLSGTSYFVIYSDSVAAKTYIVHVAVDTSVLSLTIGTEVEIHSAVSANISVAINSNVVTAVTYTTGSGLMYGYTYSTANPPVLSIKTAGVAVTSPIYNLGVMKDSTSFTFNRISTAPLTYTRKGTIGASLTLATELVSPYGSITRPTAITDSTTTTYVGSVDTHNQATFGSAGFGRVDSVAHRQQYRWSASSAVSLNMHRGANIAVVGNYRGIPQVWEGRVEGFTTATAGFGTTNTQQTAGLAVINIGSAGFAQYFPFGTSEVITAGSMYGIDPQNVGPSGAWPIPVINPASFVESGTAGSLGTGERYSYRLVKLWSDSIGNIHECVGPAFVRTSSGAAKSNDFAIPAEAFMLTVSPYAAAATVQIRVYRTEGNGSVHYFLRSLYAAASINDGAADTALDTSDALTYDGGELEDQEVGHITHATSWQGRLAVLTTDYPNKVYFSKPPENYRGVRFAAGLEIDFPLVVGGLTAIMGMDYTLFGFSRNEIFTISGALAGATGEGGSLGSPELRFKGIGCVNNKSVILTPKGIAFQSSKGIYLILRNQELTFIGEGPFASRTTSIIGAYVDETRSELHYTLSTGIEWVYDWQTNIWSSFILPTTPISSALKGDTPVFLSTAGIYTEDSSSTEVIPITMTTDWVSLTGIQGYQRVRNIELLLEYVASHTLQVDVYTDYDETTAVQTSTIASSAITPAVGVGKAFQVRIHVQNQKCEAIKIKLSSAVAGWKISGITLEVGAKTDHYKPRAQTTPNTK